MHFKFKILRCRKGLETITAVFMLLLMFAAITAFIAGWTNYNQSVQSQMGVELDRSKEQVLLINQTVEDNIIKDIELQNTGTIEVQIRALYKTINGDTVLVCDPSVDPRLNVDTHIAPTQTLLLNLLPLAIESEAKIVAATERGVKTINSIVPKTTETPPPSPNTHKYTYGLLELYWEEFQYKQFDNNFNPGGKWDPGWIVNSTSRYVAWKATITNIGTKDIILNELSSFTTVSSSSSDLRSWYLYSQPENQPQSVTLRVDVPTEVIFVWKAAGSNGYKSIYEQPTVAMVFLTFYGAFDDGKPYAQTVPFEAAITVV
jgi:hypothetical protein